MFCWDDDAGSMDLVVEGGGIRIAVDGVRLMPEDRERLERALGAHQAAICALEDPGPSPATIGRIDATKCWWAEWVAP